MMVAVRNDHHPVMPAERHHTVVVAEDSALHRTAMTAMLERAGFRVHIACDGREAIDLVRRVRPDAFVVDAVMPVMSGFEAIEHLRRDPEFASMPTIVVSGLEDVASRVRALSIGANDFVCKPVNSEELVARIDAQIRQQAAAARQGESQDRRQAAWLSDVIDGNRFDVHYQPIIDMTTGRIEAQEALVRFHDGTSPVDVFHAAATVDRLIDLELAIVAMVLANSSVVPHDVLIHVNVSPVAAMRAELALLLGDFPRPIVLEITENDQFGPSEAAALRANLPSTVRLAADDVGAGFAGLVQLVGVRPDIIKIDRAIITTIDLDPARQVVVTGLVEFAATTSAQLIAEGIETVAEATTLQQLGVRLGQGYYFGRPAPLFIDTAWPQPAGTNDNAAT